MRSRRFNFQQSVGHPRGRDVIPLGDRGCHVTCVEPASTPFKIACRVLRERHLPVTMLEGFFEDVPLSGRFAVATFSYYCYCYIPDSRRRVAALRKAATHLAVGGHVFLNYPIEARPNTLRIRFAQAVGAVCGSDWRLELGDAIAWTGSHYAYSHAFSPEEIAAEVDAAGLRVVYRRDDQNEMAIALTAH